MTIDKKGYEKLDVYQNSYRLAIAIYDTSDKITDRTILSQLKRAIVSIPLNVAEGHASLTKKDYLNHVNYAYKSSNEVRVLFNMIHDINYIDKKTYDSFYTDLDKIRSQLYNLRKKLMTNCRFRHGDRFKFYLDNNKN